MSLYDLNRVVVAQVREAADIVAVIGEVITLRHRGRNWLGLCPFHGEKTSSSITASAAARMAMR